MKRVLVTSVDENGCNRHHHVGDVNEEEFAQLFKLQGSTVYDRQRRFLDFPVLAKVYTYEADGDSWYERCDVETEHFKRVEPNDVANYLCHHIIWESCG